MKLKSATTAFNIISKYLSKEQNELQLPPLNKQFLAGSDPTKDPFYNKSKMKHKTNTLEQDQADKSRDCT